MYRRTSTRCLGPGFQYGFLFDPCEEGSDQERCDPFRSDGRTGRTSCSRQARRRALCLKADCLEAARNVEKLLSQFDDVRPLASSELQTYGSRFAVGWEIPELCPDDVNLRVRVLLSEHAPFEAPRIAIAPTSPTVNSASTVRARSLWPNQAAAHRRLPTPSRRFRPKRGRCLI